MNRRRSRRLSLWRALPPYLGGKRRLCPLIFRKVDRILPRRDWLAAKDLPRPLTADDFMTLPTASNWEDDPALWNALDNWDQQDRFLNRCRNSSSDGWV